jgi:hypothetical protein
VLGIELVGKRAVGLRLSDLVDPALNRLSAQRLVLDAFGAALDRLPREQSGVLAFPRPCEAILELGEPFRAGVVDAGGGGWTIGETPARPAIASTRAPSTPFAANSSRAASRIFRRVPSGSRVVRGEASAASFPEREAMLVFCLF